MSLSRCAIMLFLLYLALILLAPYALLSIAGRYVSALDFGARTRARVGLSLLLMLTGLGHFVKTDALVSMLPPAVPDRVELVYLTGILELFGAIGVWIPPLRRLTGVCLIVLLVAFLPVNIYAALNRVPLAGHELGVCYLLARVPLQALLIAWTYFATDQGWRRRPPLH